MPRILRSAAVLVIASCSPAAAPAVTIEPVAASASASALSPVHVESERAIDINFENLVHLVGVHFEPERAKRGERVAMTFRWRCDKTPGDGWQLLTHVVDESSNKADNLDFVGTLRQPDASGHQSRGPEHWEAGRTYTETLDYVIPEWAMGKLTVYVGIWKGAVRLRVVSGPNDGDNRGITGMIEVER
jgi:hypothetical protein